MMGVMVMIFMTTIVSIIQTTFITFTTIYKFKIIMNIIEIKTIKVQTL